MELTHNKRSLGPEGREELAEALNRLLSDVQIYHQNVRKLYWNPRLKVYFNLYNSLGQLDSMVNTGEEVLAQQILTLGFTPSTDPSDALMRTQVHQIAPAEGFDEAIKAIIQSSKELLDTVNEVFNKAVELKDDQTIQFMSQVAKQVTWNIQFFAQMRMAQMN